MYNINSLGRFGSAVSAVVNATKWTTRYGGQDEENIAEDIWNMQAFLGMSILGYPPSLGFTTKSSNSHLARWSDQNLLDRLPAKIINAQRRLSIPSVRTYNTAAVGRCECLDIETELHDQDVQTYGQTAG